MNNLIHRLGLFLLIAVSMLTYGCFSSSIILTESQKAIQEEKIFEDESTNDKEDISIFSFEIGKTIEGRFIECIVMGDGDDVIMFMASIHGDESSGTSLILSLIRHLHDHPHLLAGRQIVFLPIVNPDGYFGVSRYNANGVDLNRNFSTFNRINSEVYGLFPHSEPETRAIVRSIEIFQPDRIITFHEPLSCIDYDGPSEHLAEHLSRYCQLHVKKLGARPGSLGSYAGEELSIPIITMELPQETEGFSAEELWEQYGRTLIAAIEYRPDIIKADTASDESEVLLME